MRQLQIIILLIAIWVLWASVSVGGLYELKQLNPDYVEENKSLAYLVSKLNYSQVNGYWDSYHVKACSLYMPDWEKAEACVKARISCEYKSPQKKDAFGERADIFSKEFKSCFYEERPFFGPSEWLRTSRLLWRVSISIVALWITGGLSEDNQGEKAAEWEKNNIWWANPLTEWTERGE